MARQVLRQYGVHQVLRQVKVQERRREVLRQNHIAAALKAVVHRRLHDQVRHVVHKVRRQAVTVVQAAVRLRTQAVRFVRAVAVDQVVRRRIQVAHIVVPTAVLTAVLPREVHIVSGFIDTK